MSYPIVGPDRQRPSVVTTAGYLLYLVAGLLAVNIIVSAATFSTALNYVDTTYASDPNHDNIMTAAKIGLGVGIVLDIGLIVLFILLGIFNLRGRNGMRITAFVIAGLGTLCLGCGAFGNVAGNALQQNSTGTHETTINVRNILPGWAVDVSMAINIISMVALILVIILLATPASNAFFRKTPPMMMYPGYPPAGGGAYPLSGVQPTDPPYPTYPGGYPQPPAGPPPGDGRTPGS